VIYREEVLAILMALADMVVELRGHLHPAQRRR
jgi:hypothetical protein